MRINSKSIKIPIIFISKPQWEAGWPYLGYDNDSMMKSLIDHLNEKFPKIEFTHRDLVSTYDEKLVNEIKGDISEADVMIIFTIGHYGDPGLVKAGIEFIESGKLTILANYIYGGDHVFTKILASIKDKSYRIYPISSRNIEDFDKPIETMINLLQIKGKKILCHAADLVKMDWNRILGLVNPERKIILKDYPQFVDQVGKMSGNKDFEFYTDVVGTDQAHQWRKNEEKYKDNLKKYFDIEMVREEPNDILNYYDDISEAEAKKIAEKWVKNAKIVEPSDKTILNSARLYLAFKKLLKDKNVDFYAPDCGTFLLCGKLPAYPCMPFFELTNEKVYGICESDMDSAVSYVFGLSLSGRPGFVSNHTFDTVNNRITYMHCVAPNRLYGVEGSPAEYSIVHHGETRFLGASPRVKFPVGEPITTIKISVFNRKMAIRQGKIIDNPLDLGGCVTKVLVETDARTILENYDWDTFGWHRVSFVGDWKAQFVIGAKLLGLEIVEEDKKR